MMYYDFHIHSALSPCGDRDMTPNNIVNMAKLIGLDTIAISDHNSVGNAAAAMKVGEEVGIKVLPGMEVETEEEVHVLTLFPSLDAAYAAEKVVRAKLPKVDNQPEIFGEQYYLDENDEVVGTEKQLLIVAAALSLNELYDCVRDVGGIFIPAHVDRHSYSILTNLGFIPEDLPAEWIEISKKVTALEEYLASRPDLAGYRILRNSDAHYLPDIAEPDAAIGGMQELFGKDC